MGRHLCFARKLSVHAGSARDENPVARGIQASSRLVSEALSCLAKFGAKSSVGEHGTHKRKTT